LGVWAEQLQKLVANKKQKIVEEEEEEEEHEQQEGEAETGNAVHEADRISLSWYAADRGCYILLQPTPGGLVCGTPGVYSPSVSQGIALVLFTSKAAVPHTSNIDPLIWFSRPSLFSR
jgi:hypothetical protein